MCLQQNNTPNSIKPKQDKCLRIIIIIANNHTITTHTSQLRLSYIIRTVAIER